MIQIKNREGRNLDEICAWHCDRVVDFVTNSKRTKYFLSEECWLRRIDNANLKRLASFNFESDEITKSLLDEFENRDCHPTCNCRIVELKNILSWDDFAKKNAQELAEKLKVNICPYCNCNYTHTLTKKDRKTGTKPDFDHFFKQEDYPLLGLSFYNLIPSCGACNMRLKRDKLFTIKNNLHPYLEGIEDKARFTYSGKDVLSLIGLDKNLEVTLQTNDFEMKKKLFGPNGNASVFMLNARHTAHADVVQEVIHKHYISNGDYLNSLQNAFPSLQSSDLYRMAFGNYEQEDDFEKRPLSKMTADIVKELRFLR
jgi:hypothetical protein